MRNVHLEHEIHCDVETFWKVFLDREFNETLYRKQLAFPAYDILEQAETDSEVVRKTKGRPRTNMPAAVQKLMGDNFGYVEEGRMKKGSNLWTFKVHPSTLADKLTNEGTVRVEPIGTGKVKRLADFKLEARVFAIGGLIESTTEKEYRDGWDASATFMNHWIREKLAR